MTKFKTQSLHKQDSDLANANRQLEILSNGIFQNGELFMKNVSISGVGNDNMKRDRKILLKKRELRKIERGLDKGLTIIPTRIFENEKGRFKVEIVVARGKKVYDKRETIKKRDIDKEIGRNLK